MHDLFRIILVLVAVGFGVWAINSAPAIDPWFKKIIVGIAVIGSLFWLFRGFTPYLK